MLPWDKTFRAFLARITLRDTLLLVNMVLLCLIGFVMVVRVLLSHRSFLAGAIGFGLLFAGVYRGSRVYQILKQIRREPMSGVIKNG